MANRANRWGLAAPFLIVLVALGGWTGWWAYLVHRIETGIEATAADLRTAGYEVEYADLNTTGWPFRARVEARHLRLAAPSGHGVSAPVLVAEANAYRPDRWVMIAPDGLVLHRADKGAVAVRAPAIRASVSGFDQSAPNIALELVEPVFTPHTGAQPFPFASAERFEAYLRPHPPSPRDPASDDRADVLIRLIEAEGRDGGAVEWMSRGEPFTFEAEAVVERSSRLRGVWPTLLTDWSADGGHLSAVRGEMSAGDSSAVMSSETLRLDADRRLAGVVTLEVEQAAPALAGLARSGAVDPLGAASAAVAAGTAPAGVTLTLTFADGRTRIGPFDVAPAPRPF